MSCPAELVAVDSNNTMAEVQTLPHAPLRSSSSYTSFLDYNRPGAYRSSRKNNYSQPNLRSGSLSSSQTSSFSSTPSSSLSLNTKFDENDSDDDDGLSFPSYNSFTFGSKRSVDVDDAPPSSPMSAKPPPSPTEPADSSSTPASTPDPPLHSEDDTAVRIEPSHHVDYLSHEWKEEDIWSSWRHIVEHRKVYGERSRLENASWRTWAKAQFKLKTVSPETLNWLKDVDVTWLYGPLQPAQNRQPGQHASEPVSRLSKTNSFLHKKPILKKRSMSEVMLQKSISTSSLVKQAASVVQAQQEAGGTPFERRRTRPIIGRATSDFVTSTIPSWTTSRDPTDYFSSQSTSGLQSPDHADRKHIRFDDKVEQCIAVDCKDGDDDDDYEPWKLHDEDSSEEDGVVMMKRSRKKKPMSRSKSKSAAIGESKIIAKLPSTTLKYRTDSPDVTRQHNNNHSLGFFRSSRLSPSPSQETLRPSNPSTNFLLAEEDDDDEDDDPWEPSSAFQVKRPSTPTLQDPQPDFVDTEGESSQAGELRRTASGMMMPIDGNEDEESLPPGLIGRVVTTVNTARDIAHVIWNVGWRN